MNSSDTISSSKSEWLVPGQQSLIGCFSNDIINFMINERKNKGKRKYAEFKKRITFKKDPTKATGKRTDGSNPNWNVFKLTFS